MHASQKLRDVGESGGQQGLVLWLPSGVIPVGPPNLVLATVPRPIVTVTEKIKEPLGRPWVGLRCQFSWP